MTIGNFVAAKFKKQYFRYISWDRFDSWDIQPEDVYLILKQLRTKKAINALMGNNSWTKRLPKEVK